MTTTTPPAPDYAAFAENFAAGRGQVLWRERVADLETPVGAFLKLAAGRPNSFLLESVEGGSARGRYSAIGFDPDLVWRCRGGQAEVNRHALAAPHAFEPEDGGALDSLRRIVSEVQAPLPAGLPFLANERGQRSGRHPLPVPPLFLQLDPELLHCMRLEPQVPPHRCLAA